jgi:ABC-type molybdate transport system substrate-binding protein
MADPDSMPAGKYGKAAVEKLGVWSAVRTAVALAENARATCYSSRAANRRSGSSTRRTLRPIRA